MKKSGVVALSLIVLLLLFLAGRHFYNQSKQSTSPKAKPLVFQPIDDQFWLDLNRRRSDKFRPQLKAAPQVLMIRESHYAFNPTNGMGMHYGWIDDRLADLHIGFSELVGHAYGKDYTHTEFPEKFTHGQWTNDYDVICTLTNQPRETFQAAAKEFLKQQYGLAWHLQTKDTDVLLLRAKDPQLLQLKNTKNFARSISIPELADGLENYFGRPVIDETGATNRYDKMIGEVPSRWVNGRTTDLGANNEFLRQYGLELIATNRLQEWLVMEQAN
jgi:uncharacterized protein (TIGR03435 family)